MDLAAFQTLVRASKALKESTRARLLEVAPRLTPEEWLAIAGHLQAAEAKVETLERDTATRQQEINQRVKARGDEIVHHDLPKLMHGMEEQDRAQEAAAVESLLADLT